MESDAVDPVGIEREVPRIRPIVEQLEPERRAIEARNRCVAFTGARPEVATTTSRSRVTEDGPGPG